VLLFAFRFYNDSEYRRMRQIWALRRRVLPRRAPVPAPAASTAPGATERATEPESELVSVAAPFDPRD
jgi:hypothetical protein